MKQKTITTGRIIYGLLFAIFGLNGFLHFMPTPPPSAAAGALLMAMGKSGYFFPLVKTLELAAGLMLLSNRFVPLALTLLAAIVFNIFCLHLFLDPAGIGLAAILFIVNILLIKAYWGNFKYIFVIKVEAELKPQQDF